MMGAGHYLVFTLSDQTFGIEVQKIREVLSFRNITPLPETQSFARGIISQRGIILPVFELREKLQLPTRDYSRFHVIIVVEIGGKRMGVIADEISGLLEILPDETQKNGSLAFGLRPEYLVGVGNKGERIIFILDIDQMLNTDKLEGERNNGQNSVNRRQQIDWSYSDGNIEQARA